jgi:hypothetical protein
MVNPRPMESSESHTRNTHMELWLWVLVVGSTIFGLLGLWGSLQMLTFYRRGYAAGYEAALAVEKSRWHRDVGELQAKLLASRGTQ